VRGTSLAGPGCMRISVSVCPLLSGGIARHVMNTIQGSSSPILVHRPSSCVIYPSARATPYHASKLLSTSSSVVAHDDTLMRMAARPCQTVPPHQQVPSACRRRWRGGYFVVPERDQHLVEYHLIKYLKPYRTQPFG